MCFTNFLNNSAAYFAHFPYPGIKSEIFIVDFKVTDLRQHARVLSLKWTIAKSKTWIRSCLSLSGFFGFRAQVKRFVPQSIIPYIDSLALPDGVTRDRLLYLVDLPGRRRATDHEHCEDEFVPLHARILQSTFREYKLNIQFLIQHGILQCDNHYIPGGAVSKRYKVAGQWGSSKDYVLADVYIRSSFKKKKEILKVQHEPPQFLTTWFGGLQIDEPGALAYADIHFTELQKLNLLYQIHIIKNKEYSFVRDQTGNRLHTVLTNMKSDIRQFLSYNNQELVSADIKNSQPFFSISLLSTSTEFPPYDTTNFINDVLSGNYYEIFLERFYKRAGRKMTRDQAKEAMFTVLFSKNGFMPEEKKIFKEMYPSVYEVFRKIKKDEHNQLAIQLQRTEAHFVLDVICKKISKKYPDLPLFTIHDSVITTEGNEQIIIDMITQELSKAFPAPPQLEVEHWAPMKLKPVIKPVMTPRTENQIKKETLFGRSRKVPLSRSEKFRRTFDLQLTG